MTFSAVEPIVRAVLYEGYLLYPYRPTALKNRQRWMFGRLLPRSYCVTPDGGERWKMQTECLVSGSPQTRLETNVRFLQLLGSDTVEREVELSAALYQILDSPLERSFTFQPLLEGAVKVVVAELAPELFKLSITVENLTPVAVGQDLDQALVHSLLSALTLLHVQQGELLSMIDPPQSCRSLASDCKNVGTWPVLVGPRPGEMMLSAPIILSDYPQVAPESPGDSFDGTEIDELLALRIQTLTDAEKQQMSAAGELAHAVLQRTESLTEDQLLKLHGRLNLADTSPLAYRIGDRVRLRPSRKADAFDMLLSGQKATIIAIEHDFENRAYLAVVVDDDPGRSFGVQGLPGHRFFYHPEEVEPL